MPKEITQAIRLEAIDPDPRNPRKELGDLSELVASVKEQGVLQPILVRPAAEDRGRYLVVVGRRRLAAAKRARLETIDAVVREMSDQEAAVAGLVENLQREDLTPLDEAEAYKQILELSGWTQEQLAQHLHKSRPVITNALRLLEAPETIRAAVRDGLSPNLALIAMTIADPSLALRLKIRRGVTRPEVEAQVRELNAEWQRIGPGAEAAARAALEKARKAHPKEVVTWAAQTPPGLLPLGKVLGKAPAAIAGELAGFAPRDLHVHDRLCPCRGWQFLQRHDGTFDLGRVCLNPAGYRRFRREAGGAGGRAKVRLAAAAQHRRTAMQLLELRELRRPRVARVAVRLSRGGLSGEPARLVAFALARDHVRQPDAQLLVWDRIRKLGLPQVRKLTVGLAVADIAPLAVDGNVPRPIAALLQHYGLRPGARLGGRLARAR